MGAQGNGAGVRAGVHARVCRPARGPGRGCGGKGERMFGGIHLSSNPGLYPCLGEAGVSSGHRGAPAGVNEERLGC